MDDSNRVELSKYRYDKATECLKSAKALLNLNDYRGAVNRAYYSVYHGMRSILALDMVEFKKHSGNISYFRQNYIKQGIFDIEFSKIISLTSETRNSSDYDDFFVISKEDAIKIVNDSERFCLEVEKYLQRRYRELNNN